MDTTEKYQKKIQKEDKKNGCQNSSQNYQYRIEINFGEHQYIFID